MKHRMRRRAYTNASKDAAATAFFGRVVLLYTLLPLFSLNGCRLPTPMEAAAEAGSVRGGVAIRSCTSSGALPPSWPRQLAIPPDSELLQQIADAVDFRQREDFDRALDAVDPGELLEHATLTQAAIDRGIFGPDALFVVGDELFEYEFRPGQGLGNALRGVGARRSGERGAPNLRRVHNGAFGGPDSLSCATCHFKSGPDGAGTNTQNAYLYGDGDDAASADVRNPPHVLGLGPVEALAREMTTDLREQRRGAVDRAIESGEAVTIALSAKGVSFGSLTVQPDGALDGDNITGVDRDLVVKPFGWKGHQATLRGMAEESFRIHLGVLSMNTQRRVRDGELPPDDFGDGPWYDLDRDGSTMELDDGMLTTMVAYLAQLEVPIVRPPQSAELLDDFARGRTLFEESGCGECHRPFLVLNETTFELQAAGEGDEARGAITIDLARDGEHPKIEAEGLRAKTHRVHLFSDLKRHDMGPALASPTAQGEIPASVFLTRPLWGLAFSGPYLHDGRAPTVDDAIRLHGGAAVASRDRYLALAEEDRGALRVFLMSLTRKPELFVP